MNWNMSGCVRNDIIQEKYQVTIICSNCHLVEIYLSLMFHCAYQNVTLYVRLLQMERLFAGYLASDDDSNQLRNVFRVIPKVMESRLGEKEWDIVINLSNDIFKVLRRNKWDIVLQIISLFHFE